MHKKTQSNQGNYHWKPLADAARHLTKTAAGLRRMIQRNAKRGPKGIWEARFNNIVARKFGGRWLVSLPDWT